jgi:SP family sugar porter-like MFS transporter
VSAYFTLPKFISTFYNLHRGTTWQLGIGLLVLQQLSGINAVLFYASSIFKAAGITNSDLATFALGAIQVLATGVTTWLVDRAGRRILLTISSAGMTLSLLVVAVAFFVKDNLPHDSHMYYILSMLSLVAIVVCLVNYNVWSEKLLYRKFLSQKY